MLKLKWRYDQLVWKCVYKDYDLSIHVLGNGEVFCYTISETFNNIKEAVDYLDSLK